MSKANFGPSRRIEVEQAKKKKRERKAMKKATPHCRLVVKYGTEPKPKQARPSLSEIE